MTRGILILIIMFDMVFVSQLPLVLGDTEDSDEYIADSISSLQESVENSNVSRQTPMTPNSITQYLQGVMEYNEGNVELAKIWFQQAYESLESEDGKNVAQTQAFGRTLDKSPPRATPAKVQFPEGCKVDIYDRDGWYIQPKANEEVRKKNGELQSSIFNLQPSFKVYSFLPGSTYKILLEVEDEHPATKEINIGMKVIAALIMASWVMAR